MKKNSLVKKADSFVLIFIAIFCAISIFLINYSNSNPVAYVYENSNLVKEINLAEVKEPYEISLSNNGYDVVIEVENGTVYYKEANCSDKICVNSGKLSKNGDTAVCVPSQTMIVVKSNSNSVYLTY